MTSRSSGDLMPMLMVRLPWGVGIYQKDTLAGLGKAHAEVDSCCRLANTARLVGDGNDLCAHVFHLLSIEIKKGTRFHHERWKRMPFCIAINSYCMMQS